MDAVALKPFALLPKESQHRQSIPSREKVECNNEGLETQVNLHLRGRPKGQAGSRRVSAAQCTESGAVGAAASLRAELSRVACSFPGQSVT